MIAEQLKERKERRANLTANRGDQIKQNIPEPVVLKNDAPCKGLKLLSDGTLMLVGLESGVVKVLNRTTLQVLAEHQLMQAPILKIEQVLQAIIVQFKDQKGSLIVYKLTKELTFTQILEMHTFSTGFTLFVATTLIDEDESNFITLVT